MKSGRRDPVEKRLLEILIPKFDEENNTGLGKKILLDASDLNYEIERHVPSPDDKKIQIKWLKNDVCFRIKFSLPVLLLFHVSTRHSRELHGYFKPLAQDFTVPSAFIPTYNCNLNHLTLLKTSMFEKTRSWFGLNEGEEEEYICKKMVSEKETPMSQSSMNFLLQENSIQENVSASVAKNVMNCFENFYWRPPLMLNADFKYSTIHNMIYHSWHRIFSSHRIYKTIAKINDLQKNRYSFRFGRKKITFVWGNASILFQDDQRFYNKDTNLAIAEPDASRIGKGDVVNCIIDRPIFSQLARPPKTILSGVVGNTIDSTDLKSLIAITIWKKMQEIDEKTQLCKVGYLKDIKSQVQHLIHSNRKVFDQFQNIYFDECFRKSLNDLYPLILEKDEIVYHVPPPLMSFLLAKEIPIFESKESLVKLLELVDLITPDTHFGVITKLRFSKLGEEVQMGPCKTHWESILENLPRIANRIYYSRIFARSATQN